MCVCQCLIQCICVSVLLLTVKKKIQFNLIKHFGLLFIWIVNNNEYMFSGFHELSPCQDQLSSADFISSHHNVTIVTLVPDMSQFFSISQSCTLRVPFIYVVESFLGIAQTHAYAVATILCLLTTTRTKMYLKSNNTGKARAVMVGVTRKK